MLCGQTSTLVVATNPEQPGRNAHVHARYFYVRDLAWEDLIELLHCPIDLQLVDIGFALTRVVYNTINFANT